MQLDCTSPMAACATVAGMESRTLLPFSATQFITHLIPLAVMIHEAAMCLLSAISKGFTNTAPNPASLMPN